MDTYKVYGNFYDATQESGRSATYLRLLREHNETANTVLEIACGTASHLEPLANDYAVEGLDISPTMIKYARKRMPAVRFHQKNMVCFDIGKTFDAVISPYDSINHLLKFSDWKRTFKAAARHLNTNGVFIFDVNTESKLKQMSLAPS